MAEKQSVLGRVTALAQADVQTLIDDSADPEALFLALGRAFATTLAEAEDALAAALAAKRLTEHDRAEDQQTADDWGIHAATAAYHAAELRIEGNMSGAAVFDDLARTALERQLTTERAVADAAGVVAALASYVDTLREQLDLAKDRLALLDERRAHQIGHLEPEDGRILDPETAQVLDPDTELRTFEEKLLREDERQSSTLEAPSYLDGRFTESVDPALRSEVERRLELLRPDEDELVAALAARASAEAERVAEEAERLAAQAQHASADVIVDDLPVEDAAPVEPEAEQDAGVEPEPQEEPAEAPRAHEPAEAPAEPGADVAAQAEPVDEGAQDAEPVEAEADADVQGTVTAGTDEPQTATPPAEEAAEEPAAEEPSSEDAREPEIVDDVETNVVVEQDAVEPFTVADEPRADRSEGSDDSEEPWAGSAPTTAAADDEPETEPETETVAQSAAERAAEPEPEAAPEAAPEPEPAAEPAQPVAEAEPSRDEQQPDDVAPATSDDEPESFVFPEERSRPVGGRRRANVPVRGPDDEPYVPPAAATADPAPAPAPPPVPTPEPEPTPPTEADQAPVEQDPEPPRPQGFSMHPNDPFPRTNPLAGIADVEAAYRLARAQEETQWDLPAFVDEPEPGPSAFAAPFAADPPAAPEPMPFAPGPFPSGPSTPGPFTTAPQGRDEDELPTAEYPAIRFDTFGGPASAAALAEPEEHPLVDPAPRAVPPQEPSDDDGDALARRRARRSREIRNPGVPTAYDIAYDPTQGPAHPSFLDPPGARDDSGGAQVFPLRPRGGENPPDQPR
ncbi:hypothetical protein [Mumia sp. DW29H23]|uniref:hypothetical protein n=1 Tax=Mumia sp. DW29H23 TaxID=3421241 RepID=UPI003D693C00